MITQEMIDSVINATALAVARYGDKTGREFNEIVSTHVINAVTPLIRACRSKPAESESQKGLTLKNGLLNPDMPDAEMRLHCGEMTAGELCTARAVIRWANSVAEKQKAKAGE